MLTLPSATSTARVPRILVFTSDNEFLTSRPAPRRPLRSVLANRLAPGWRGRRWLSPLGHGFVSRVLVLRKTPRDLPA